MLNKSILSIHWKRLPLISTRSFREPKVPKELADFEFLLLKRQKPTKTFVTQLIAFANRKFNIADIKHYTKWKEIETMREQQKYLTERHQILGPNLATAHFICAQGGKVKFKGNDKWFTEKDLRSRKIPGCYVEGYFVEEVDASGTNLCYEGFENLCNLFEFKKLILQNCPFVDDWCLSRSHLFEKTLQYLDLSGCENITERGICALHPLRELKTLVLNNTPKVQNRELVSLLLQDIIPQLEIIGVSLIDPEILKEIDVVTN